MKNALVPLIAASVFAITSFAAPAKTRSKPQQTVFVGEGVMDLEGRDISRPIMVRLNYGLGHFVRIVLPNSFQSGDLWLTPNSALRVDSRRMKDGRWAIDITQGTFDAATATPLGIQNSEGKAILLCVTFRGHRRDTPWETYQSFWKAHGNAFPEDAGPQIEPLKPTILLDTAEMTFDQVVAIESMEPKHGGSFVAVIRKDIRRSSHGFVTSKEGEVLLPAGTKVLGTVMTALHGKWHLWAQKVVFPDGSQREANGNTIVPRKPTTKNHD